MRKAKRSERIVALTRKVLERPSHLFSLMDFCEEFSVAKSTMSEDLQIIREALQCYNMGTIETVTGASGGVKFVPNFVHSDQMEFLQMLATTLSEEQRIVAGGYIYMNDIIFRTDIANKIGEVFYCRLQHLRPNYIMTVETKGIPLAMMTARLFDVPLVTVRRDSQVTEGSSVGINFVSGSTKRLQTMSLPKRAVKKGSKIIIIDDLMKAGGTAKGLTELAKEVGAEVIGIGVLLATVDAKVLNEYISLLTVDDAYPLGERVSVSEWNEA